MNLKERVKELEPWRHNIDLGPFTTFDVAKAQGPNKKIGHPKPRWDYVKQWIPYGDGKTALDIGCNAGRISFELEKIGWEVTGIDNGHDKKHGIGAPLKQAQLCKEVLDSEVKFVKADVMDFLPKNFDLVFALAVLYHVRDDEIEEPGVERSSFEKSVVDKMISSANKELIIETKYREWLRDYLEEKGVEVIANKVPEETPEGSRHVVVGNLR